MLLSAALLLAVSPAQGSTKLVTIVWDGAPRHIVERLVAEGKLPNVKRIADNGVQSSSVVPAWPSKTACGHAAMFTGAWADVNGVSNNSVPLMPAHEHTYAESRRGFDANSLTAEPVWLTAALAGKKVAALSAAVSFPPDPFVAAIKANGGDPKKFVEFSGFETTIAAPRMHRSLEGTKDGAHINFTIRVGDTDVQGELFDDATFPVSGLDSVRFGADNVIHVKEAHDSISGWSKPIRVKKGSDVGNVYFRLFALNPDGTGLELYQRQVSAIRGTEDPTETEKYIDAYGAHHDDPFFNYQSGMFGTPLYKGGDGTAENRILEVVRHDCEMLKKGFAYGWNHWKPDLLMHYTPMSDSAGHAWMGALDPTLSGHDPLLAKRIMPFYERVFQLQDEWLGFILDTVGDQVTVALLSDHGMTGANKTVYVNKVLQDAGLLTFDASRRLDLSKSSLFVPSWSDFFAVINREGRKGGIVNSFDEQALLDRAKQALLNARDPQTNQPIFTAVFLTRDAAGMGLGGPAGGDLYYELAPGYYPSNRQSDNLIGPYGNEIGGGVHGYMPYRKSMSAVFYASGPGLKKGASVPSMRQIDIFPTLCTAVGFPVMKDATGGVLHQLIQK